MDTLDFYKDMYSKGYMNEDFYLVKGNDKYSAMLSGKAGMMMTSNTNAAYPNGKFDPLIKENPNAKIAYTNTFIQDNGTPITNSIISVGALGGDVFPKTGAPKRK
jgi:ABC-type glycerol-3-phosphate transport system substrate-binding protein